MEGLDLNEGKKDDKEVVDPVKKKKLGNLQTWLREIVMTDTSKVEAVFLSDDRRSIRAACKLEPDETILSIPDNYLLTLDRVKANSRIC